MRTQLPKRRGFTIVELLIVIVVIAILAAISVAVYTGVQQRARDSQRKSDVAAIVKALKLYEVDNGPMYVGSGCGSSGNGSGWINYPYGGAGGDINECLKTAGYLTATIKDPHDTSNCTAEDLDCRKYAKLTCNQSGSIVTYIYANLETVGHTANDTNGTCSAVYDTDFGMNYWVKL